MLPPVTFVLARRRRRTFKTGCAALSFKIFSASHSERLPSFSISSVLFFAFLPFFSFMKKIFFYLNVSLPSTFLGRGGEVSWFRNCSQHFEERALFFVLCETVCACMRVSQGKESARRSRKARTSNSCKHDVRRLCVSASMCVRACVYVRA